MGTLNRRIRTAALVPALLAGTLGCSDPLQPSEPFPFHEPFVAESVGPSRVPSEVRPLASGYSLTVLGGSLRCPHPDSPFSPSEVYVLRFGYRDGSTEERTVRFVIDCAVTPPDQIRFTYSATGETVVATFWSYEGEVHLTKPMPSEEAFHVTAMIKYPYISRVPQAIFVPAR